jgi:ParB-like chromosome segregation protein Spo0J
MSILISKIRIDGGTQNRVQIDPSTVKEYSDAITEGSLFPPVIIFFDGVDYWLADGFHRYHAHKNLGILEINAEVTNGTKRDAILYSVGVNAKHGLKRTNADKRKSVETLLGDPEWSKWSDNAIAKRCLVSNHLVSEIRKSHLGEFQDSNDETYCDQPQDTKRTVERNGKTYEQDTSNIGKSQQQKQDAEQISPKKQEPKASAKEEDKSREELYGSFNPIAELEAANTEIDRLTKIIEADDRLAEANKEIKRLSSLCETQQYRINSLMSEKVEAVRHAQRYKHQLEKLEKQVKAAGLEDF